MRQLFWYFLLNGQSFFHALCKLLEQTKVDDDNDNDDDDVDDDVNVAYDDVNFLFVVSSMFFEHVRSEHWFKWQQIACNTCDIFQK